SCTPLRTYSFSISLTFFFKYPPTPDPSPLSLHDALPICRHRSAGGRAARARRGETPARQTRASTPRRRALRGCGRPPSRQSNRRSEEHTSELQSRENLVCRLLLEKKKKKHKNSNKTCTKI